MDILTIMDLAAEMEDRAALLYHSYSRHFKDNPQACTFWEGFCLEEKKHADMVRTYRRQRLNLPVYRNSHPYLEDEIEAALSTLIGNLKRVEHEHISSALLAGYRLEGLMVHAHLHRIGEVGDPILAKLFIKLGQEDRHHQEKIRQIAKVFPHGLDFNYVI